MSDVKAVYEQEPAAVILGGGDAFNDAFNDAVADKPQGEDQTVPVVVEPEAEVEGAAQTETAPAEVAPEPEVETAEPDYQAELARMRSELDALKRPSEPQQQAQPEPEAPPLYTAEQQQALDGFKKEWPEVAAGIELMMRQVQYETAQQVFNALAPTLNPVLDYYQTSAVDMQYAQLVKAHPDYDQIYENVLQWVDKQPSYMKTAMQHVVEEGSAAEVVDMINRYKMEAGKPLAAVPAPAAKVTDLPEAAKKVARSLGVVSSKRSAVPQSQDPTDFDGAWTEAMNG
jgi:hypothetical protein